MNFDTEELAICTHHVWCELRRSFLDHHHLDSGYHKKFFARLEAKQGYKYIAWALAQHECHPSVSSAQYMQHCSSTSIVEPFLPDLMGYGTFKNDKKNTTNFLGFVQDVLSIPVNPHIQIIETSQPSELFIWPDATSVLAQRCSDYANEHLPLYNWSNDWVKVFEEYEPKMQRELRKCVSGCALINENVVGHLLGHHLNMETTDESIQLAITSAHFFTYSSPNVEVGPYTMRGIAEKLCENILVSLRWDMECLEAGLQSVLKLPSAPIAFSPQKRHNR